MMCARFISKIGFVSKISAAILFLTLTGSFAQSTAGSIRGQVISVTGDPVRKADVTLRFVGKRPGPGNVMLSPSDAAGKFVFNNLDPGNYIVSGQKNGFVSQNRRRPAVQAVSVAFGQEVDGIIIKLAPQAVVTGKIIDEDGEPVFGAGVSVLEERYFRGRQALESRATCLTNDLGEYRIPSLPPGHYRVAVRPREEPYPPPLRPRASGQETDQSYVPVYYPGVFQQTEATALDLKLGEEAHGIDVQLRKTATVHLRGRVLDDTGNPLPSASLMVLSGDHAATAESTLAVTGTIADVQVLLAKGAVTIEGTVADSDGKPVSESSIAVLPPPEKRADRGLFRSTESDQSGRFTLRNLRPGEYTLVALGVDEDASNVQNPEYLKRIEKKGTTLKLTENLSGMFS